MKLLVTGGTGFTGSRLVEFLLEKGHHVTCLDNQEGQYVDALDRPHICVWHLLNDKTNDARDPANSAYYHYWRDTTGTWKQNEIFSPVGDGCSGKGIIADVGYEIDVERPVF